MKFTDLENLLKPDIDQVFLFSSPLPVPANFAVHAWLVTADKENQLNRWDVWDRTKQCKTSWGHVHKNIMKPTDGLIIWFWEKKIKWRSKFYGDIEGELASKMIAFIEKEAPEYKFKDHYMYLPGPNSNSFIQWIINHFPESEFKLGPQAIGRNYKGIKVK